MSGQSREMTDPVRYRFAAAAKVGMAGLLIYQGAHNPDITTMMDSFAVGWVALAGIDMRTSQLAAERLTPILPGANLPPMGVAELEHHIGLAR